MTGRRVVVTGRGVISPLGIGIEKHRARLFSSSPCIRKSERLSAMEYPLSSAGEIPAETLEPFMSLIPPKQRKLMNRAGIFVAIASLLAAKEAKLDEIELEPTRMGIFLATWFTSYHLPSFVRYLADTESRETAGAMDSEKANTAWLEKMNPLDYSLKVLPNLSAGHLAILHQAQGGSRVIADGWRGGLLAVAQAAQAIREGELDVILAGGSESPLEDGIFGDLCNLSLVAKDEGCTDGICRPFDVTRRGTVLGEGAGVVILEEREHASRREVAIFGEVTGWGSAGPGQEGDRVRALTLSMRKALAQSEIEPGEVDIIHANGDSSLENDEAESIAVDHVFKHSAADIPVTATKSLHGHLLSATGVVELISSLIMLEEGMVPSIAHCERPDPKCHLNLVRGSPLEKPALNAVLLNAIGLFGEAASLLIKR